MSKTKRISAGEQAQLLLDEAMDASTDKKAKQLIEKALEVDPHCVDGWNLLADLAETPEEALELFQRSVKIGRDLLGEQFRELIGVFWLDIDTRPYMRALEGLAHTWRAMGKWSEAIAVWETMLELNPNDNQGVRWPLLEVLLFTEDNRKAATLVDSQYPDDAYALWNWARWLLAFRSRQPEDQLRELMHNAHENNPSVVKWLLGDRPLPAELPSEMVLGEESEALCVASGFLPAFTSTPGAKTWLRQAAVELNLDHSPDPEQLRQDRFVSLNEAKEVDQQLSGKWMVEHRKFKFEGKPVWAVLVAGVDPLTLRRCEILEYSPKPEDMLDIVLRAILQPEIGKPLRPGIIQFSLKTLAKTLARRLDQLNIQCEVGSSSEMDEAFEVFRLTLKQDPKNQPGLAEPFVEPELHQDMIWQIGVFRLPTVIEEKGVRTRPWGVLVADKLTGMIFGFDLVMDLPDSGTLKQLIERTLHSNPVGRPVRPKHIEVRTNDELMTIQDFAKSISVPVVINAELDAFDNAVREIVNRQGESVMPSTGEISGLSQTDRTYFYHSACEFYKSRPWTRTRSDAVFRVTIPEYDELFACPMGQSGAVIGLALFTSVSDVAAMFNQNHGRSRRGKRKPKTGTGRSWSVLYGEAFEIPQTELDAIDLLGLPVAGAEAYPELAEIVNGRPVALTNAGDVLRTAICLNVFARAPLADSDSLIVPVGIPNGSESEDQRVVNVKLESIEI